MIANAMKYLGGAVFIDEKHRGYCSDHDAAGAAAYLGCVSGQAAPSGCRLEPGVPARRRDLLGT